MIKYKRGKQQLCFQAATPLDPTDRSPLDHSFQFEKSRRIKDLFCIAREQIMSLVLKIKYRGSGVINFKVLAKEWSMSLQRQRSFCCRRLNGLGGKTVLVLGCGFGGDALSWIPLGPARVIGVDIINYKKCWEKAASQFATRKNQIDFYQFDLVASEWDFVTPGSVDIIFSYAVLEHLADLKVVLERAKKTLKPNGLFVASYGPLWYGPNGDHTFPILGDDVYNHLILDDNDYAAYVERTIGDWHHFENGGEGPFLLERGYFSYLKPGDYLDAFKLAGFECLVSILNISTRAEQYFAKFPDRLVELKNKHKLDDIDLYSNGSTIILEKKG